MIYDLFLSDAWTSPIELLTICTSSALPHEISGGNKLQQTRSCTGHNQPLVGFDSKTNHCQWLVVTRRPKRGAVLGKKRQILRVRSFPVTTNQGLVVGSRGWL